MNNKDNIKQRLKAWVQANAKELLLEDGGHIEHANRMAWGWVEDIEERPISDKQKQMNAERVINDNRRLIDDWKERRRSNRQNPQIKVINRDKDGGEMEGTMYNPAYIVPAFKQRRTELLSGAIIYALEMAFGGKSTKVAKGTIKKYPLISELSYLQKSHMVWRADKYTAFGLVQIGRLCRGEVGDMPLNKAFEKLGMRPHQAKWHATTVANYDPLTYKPIKS